MAHVFACPAGLPLEKKRRWCGTCSQKHEGAVKMSVHKGARLTPRVCVWRAWRQSGGSTRKSCGPAHVPTRFASTRVSVPSDRYQARQSQP